MVREVAHGGKHLIVGELPFGICCLQPIVYFKEYKNNQWVWSSDVKSMPADNVVYKLNGKTNMTFNQLFHSYDWSINNGYNNLGIWVETAAKLAGR